MLKSNKSKRTSFHLYSIYLKIKGFNIACNLQSPLGIRTFHYHIFRLTWVRQGIKIRGSMCSDNKSRTAASLICRRDSFEAGSSFNTQRRHTQHTRGVKKRDRNCGTFSTSCGKLEKNC